MSPWHLRYISYCISLVQREQIRNGSETNMYRIIAIMKEWETYNINNLKTNQSSSTVTQTLWHNTVATSCRKTFYDNMEHVPRKQINPLPQWHRHVDTIQWQQAAGKHFTTTWSTYQVAVMTIMKWLNTRRYLIEH